MDNPMPSGRHQEVEVITGVQRRRRWPPEQKLEWVRRTMEPGMSVSLVAREAGITASQLFPWRKAYTEGSLVAVGANEPVVPASELQEAIKCMKQLEAALGRKTLENDILKEAVEFAKAKKWIARSPLLPGDEQWAGMLGSWRSAQSPGRIETSPGELGRPAQGGAWHR
jgi:transposase